MVFSAEPAIFFAKMAFRRPEKPVRTGSERDRTAEKTGYVERNVPSEGGKTGRTGRGSGIRGKKRPLKCRAGGDTWKDLSLQLRKRGKICPAKRKYVERSVPQKTNTWKETSRVFRKRGKICPAKRGHVERNVPRFAGRTGERGPWPHAARRMPGENGTRGKICPDSRGRSGSAGKRHGTQNQTILCPDPFVPGRRSAITECRRRISREGIP